MPYTSAQPSASRQWPAIAAALLITTLAALAPAQPAAPHTNPPADPPPTATQDDSEISAGDQTLDIDKQPADARIAARLTEILTATDRFTDLRVEVRDGVVFLAGQAASETMQQLAADLARRTDGVAAVVNNISIAQDPVWSIQPAREELEELLRDAVRATPKLAVGLALLALFLLTARLIDRLAGRLISRTTSSELLQNVLQKAILLAFILLGLYLALRVTGLTRVALAVVSGTGLIGLALGFAFRDIAENFLASILLSVQRPFRLGDVITVDGHTGVVRKVTSRGTLLIDFDGNHIQIANATVYKNTIKNFTANPKMRIDFLVGIGYDDEVSRAQAIIRAVLEAHPAVLNDPEPLVLVEQLASSAVNLRVYFWIDGNEHSMLKMKSSVMRLTLNALTTNGVSLPDDAREVIFPNGVPVQMLEPPHPSAAQSPPRKPQSPPDPPRPPSPHATDIAVESEGDLSTETHDLNRQADQSRDPESGTNVLPKPDRPR